MESRALVTADLERLPGLRTRRWAADGAAFGLAASSGLAALAGGLVGGHEGWGLGLLTAGALIGPATAVGAVFGRRWRAWLRRDAGRVTVKRWLGRLAADGALAGAASGALAPVVLSVGLVPRPEAILFEAGLGALVAGPAGAVLLSVLGLPYVLGLVRGRRPWGILALAAVTAPPVLFGTTMVAAWVARAWG